MQSFYMQLESFFGQYHFPTTGLWANHFAKAMDSLTADLVVFCETHLHTATIELLLDENNYCRFRALLISARVYLARWWNIAFGLPSWSPLPIVDDLKKIQCILDDFYGFTDKKGIPPKWKLDPPVSPVKRERLPPIGEKLHKHTTDQKARGAQHMHRLFCLPIPNL
jgi:hypothetical protein